MSIYYVDFNDGDDSLDGLSFATRKKSLVKILKTVSTGDEVRIMKTPGGLLSSNSTWTSSGQPKKKVVSNLTAVNNAGVITVTHTAHGYETGDLIHFTAFGSSCSQLNGYHEITVVDENTYIMDDNTNPTTISYQSTRYVTKCSNMLVKLDQPKTANLINCVNQTSYQADWIKSTNVTIQPYSPSGLSYSLPTRANLTQIGWNNNFTTGLVAYHTFPTSLDLSEYRQLSFHMFFSTGEQRRTPHWKICLCSDAAGSVIEYEFPVIGGGVRSKWRAYTVDCSNLPAGQTMTTPIQSIAIYVDADRGSYTMRLQNVIACKSPLAEDCVTHTSQITTKRPGDIWYPIGYVDRENIIMGTHDFSTLNVGTNRTGTGYSYTNFQLTEYDTVETDLLRETGLPCYVNNPVNTYALDTAGGTYGPLGYNPLTDSENVNGWTSKNYITIQGGYNRTDMSTVDDLVFDRSWLSIGGQAWGLCLYNQQNNFCNYRNLGFHGGMDSFYISSFCTNSTMENCSFTQCGNGIKLRGTSHYWTLKNISSANVYRGVLFGTSNANGNYLNGFIDRSSSGALYLSYAFSNRVKNCDLRLSDRAIYLVQNSSSYFSDINIQGCNYVFYIQNGFFDGVNNNMVAKANERFMNAQLSASYYYNADWKHDNLEVSGDGALSFAYGQQNYRPLPGGNSPNQLDISWFPSSALLYGQGYGDPYQSWGYSDGTWIAWSYNSQMGAYNGPLSAAYSGSNSLRISNNGANVRTGSYIDVNDAVSDPANEIYSRGNSSRLTLAKVSVVANQIVTFSVQAKIYGDIPEIKGNLLVDPRCGLTQQYRSATLASNDWVELSVSVLPTEAGILHLEFEHRSYFGNSSNPLLVNFILVDSLSVSQG